MVLPKVTADDIILSDSDSFNMKEGFYNPEGFKVTYRDMLFNVDKIPGYHLKDFLRDVLGVDTSNMKTPELRAKYLELVEGSYSDKIKKDVKPSSQPFIQLPAPFPSVPSVPFIPLPSPIYSIPSTGRKTVKKTSKKKTSVKKSSKKSSRKTVKKVSKKVSKKSSKKGSKKVSKKGSKKGSKKSSKKSSKKTGSRKRKY